MRAVDWLCKLHQKRLIPMRRNGKILLKEPVLDGCQRHIARDLALFGQGRLAALCRGGLPGNGRKLKNLACCQAQAMLRRV